MREESTRRRLSLEALRQPPRILAASGAGFTSASTDAASNRRARPNWKALRFIATASPLSSIAFSIDSRTRQRTSW